MKKTILIPFSLLKSTLVANRVKEKVAITLFLKDDVTTENRNDLKASLQKEEFTKKIIYTSKHWK